MPFEERAWKDACLAREWSRVRARRDDVGFVDCASVAKKKSTAFALRVGRPVAKNPNGKGSEKHARLVLSMVVPTTDCCA